MLASDYISQVRSLIHDIGTVDWSDSELLTIVNNARQRVALDLHCVRQFYTALDLINGREIYPITGGIGGVVVVAGGTGYPASPAITIGAPPAGGIQATASATAVGGIIQSVTMTNWGSGYLSTPTVSAAVGVGANLTATLLSPVIDILSISVLYPGNLQRYMLTFQPFTPFQAFFRANPVGFSNPSVWSVHAETNQLFFYAIPNQPYKSEIDAIILPTNLATTASNDTQVIMPCADAVQYYSAHLALAKLQNVDMADYWRRIYGKRVQEIQHTRQDRRIQNPYRTFYRRINRL